MHDDLHRLLRESDRGTSKAQGPLARLYRQILFDLNITPHHFDTLMTRWLNDPKNKVPDHSARRSNDRGNMTKALLKSEMTFKSFIRAVSFLSPIKMDLEVRLHWSFNSKITIHSISMLMAEMDEVEASEQPDTPTEEIAPDTTDV